jgi:nicotinate-nucleotide pyrophosphorylase (carboxylating)
MAAILALERDASGLGITQTEADLPLSFDPDNPSELRATVRRALEEDIGAGDLTAGLIPATRVAEARVVGREAAVLCGTPWFDEVYRQLDPAVQVTWHVRDGQRMAPGQTLCELRGPARALLTGERTALNLLQTLSGTATAARRYADAVAGMHTRILDTRKTLPGLRSAQKYAVRCGGCHNHRMGLYDAILIKENHILAAGSIAEAIAAARKTAPGVAVEVEVEDLQELEQALAAGAERVLLDDFDVDQLRQAVRLAAGRAVLEASGGVHLGNVRQLAETGVDFISVGGLTKHVQAVDLSMRFVN